MGYHAVISAFIGMDEIEESKMLYEEPLSVKTTYDARIGNRLLGWYVRKGHSEKTESFFKEMLEIGKANSSTREILAEGHIKHKRISDALSCFEKALSHEELSFWKPKPVNIISFLKICEEKHDERSKEVFFGMLKEASVLEDESLMSKLLFLKDSNDGNELPQVKESEDYDDEDVDSLLNELQASM